MQKRWNIFLVPSGPKQGYNMSFRTRTLTLIALMISLSSIGGLTYFTYYGIRTAKWKKDQVATVAGLKNEIEQRDSDLRALNTEFTDIRQLESKLRAMAGLQPREETSAELGEGGQGGREVGISFLSESAEHFQSAPQPDNRFLSGGALLHDINLARASMSEILEALEREHRLLSVPSLNPVSSPDAWISSGFGYRKDPLHGKRRFHEGMDIVAFRDTPIIAPAEGVVTFSGWRAGLGRTVEIRHDYGYRTTYGHNGKLVVKEGDHVKRGDTIALLGNSGRSTGPHLHYEIRLNGKLVNPYRYVID